MKGKSLLDLSKVFMLLLVLMFLLSNAVYAGVSQNGSDVKFTKFDILGNRYKEIATGSKKNDGAVLHVTVTYMYDASGNLKDDYKKTRWKIYKDGVEFSEEIIVQKGVSQSKIEMDEKVTSDDIITVQVKGNKSSLDAKISGELHNFNLS